MHLEEITDLFLSRFLLKNFPSHVWHSSYWYRSRRSLIKINWIMDAWLSLWELHPSRLPQKFGKIRNTELCIWSSHRLWWWQLRLLPGNFVGTSTGHALIQGWRPQQPFPIWCSSAYWWYSRWWLWHRADTSGWLQSIPRPISVCERVGSLFYPDFGGYIYHDWRKGNRNRGDKMYYEWRVWATSCVAPWTSRPRMQIILAGWSTGLLFVLSWITFP